MKGCPEMTHACGPVGDEDRLRLDLLRDGLGRSLFAGNIVYQETLDSTNDIAKEMALQGAPEGTLVLTDEQRAGRGRRGRSWLSPGRSNLLFSVLLRPVLDPDRVFVLTMILALAAVDALKKIAGLPTMIKWPNDLYVGHKKLAGILTEFSTRERALEYVILGLGLNVNWYPDDGTQVSGLATSVLAETGARISRSRLLLEILRGFENSLLKVLKGEIDGFYRKWNEISLIIGRQVVIEAEREKIYGKAIRIDEGGALIVQDKEGKQERIISGDVSVRWGEEE